MTTRMTRTMLPPNLTRHFYETRRRFLESAGQESTPWFQLSTADRVVIESEMELFRQAIRAAEEEQDLLASLNAATTEPVAETAAAGDSLTEDCDCPGCSAVAALLELLARTRKGFEAALPQEAAAAPGTFRIIPLTVRPLSDAERARLQKAAEDAIAQWVAAGKPIKVYNDQAPGSWIPRSRLDLDVLGPSRFDLMRWGFWKQPSPQAFLRDVGKL
jgi:hypothetical protein